MKLKKVIAFVMALVIVLTGIYFEKPAVKVEAAGTKLVAFTFDDGPGYSGTTSRLLDGLAARGAKATFFMNGRNGAHGVVNNMSVVRRMASEGHQLANHTYSHHVPFSGLSSASMASEVAQVNSYLYDAMGGNYQTLVRIPGGDRSSRISASVNAPMILWSVDTLDWKYRNANTVYNNIMNHVSDGSIVLLHDLYGSSVDGALRAISDLQARGYECVTVSELFRRRGLSLSNGSTYTSAGVTGVNLPGYSAPEIDKTFDNYGNTNIKITNPNSGTTLRYTTDGSNPLLSSSEWSDGVKLPEGATVKIAGFDKFGTRTPIASFTYTSANDYYGTFDAKFYADKYPDLKAAFGYDAEDLWNHYINFGIKEGRQGSAIFSISDYKKNYPDLRNAFGNDNEKYLKHFSKYGMKEGRTGIDTFSVRSYRFQYPDLRKAYGSNNRDYYIHYMKYGYKEHRITTGCEDIVGAETVYNGVDYRDVYDYVYYVNKYPDIRRAFVTDDKAVLAHFVTHGMKEGRQGCAAFDVQTYKAKYADLRKAFGNDNTKYYLHFIKNGKKEGRTARPEAVKNPTTMWNGVDYSAVYDYKQYVEKYPDIKKAFGTDDVATIRHFVRYGMKEGRQAKSTFDVNSYVNNYKDLRRAYGSDKVKYYYHFIWNGSKEGRKAVNVPQVMNYDTVYNGIDYSKVYDYNYYVKKYPDIRKAFGKDDAAVLKHFVNNGMKEFRQAKADFNPVVYKNYNADLKKAFGNNNAEYYRHYIRRGYTEHRKTY